METLKSKIIDRLVLVILVILLTTMVAYIIFLIVPINVVDFKEVKVQTPIIQQGEDLRFHLISEKYVGVVGIKECSFRDELIHPLSSQLTNVGIGKHDDIIQIDVPKSLPADNYTYFCKFTYEIFGRIVIEEMETDAFQVVEKQ